MPRALAERLDLGPRELVSIVGAGGKTTILHTLGSELAATGRPTFLTTTTRMARGQVSDPVVWSDRAADIAAGAVAGSPLFVLSGDDAGKVVGLSPAAVNRLYAQVLSGYVIVEADGARSMSIKAPGRHEPVIPSASSLVVAVVGADALGERIADVAHRPDAMAALAGVTIDDIVTPQIAAATILHADGGLKAIPEMARAVVVMTKVGAADRRDVAAFAEMVEGHRRVDRVLTIA